MPGREIIFSDITKIAENKSLFSDTLTRDKWRAMRYEAGKVSGTLLAAGEMTTPPELVLDPALSGYYRISIAMLSFGSNRFDIRLTDDDAFVPVTQPAYKYPGGWGVYEYVSESFWKCADMTGQKIVIRKPNVAGMSCIAWLKFEEMSADEISERSAYDSDPTAKNAHYHFDDNNTLIDEMKTADDDLGRTATMKNTDLSLCSIEVVDDFDTEDTRGIISLRKSDYECANKALIFHRSIMDEAYPRKIALVHKYGGKAYAAYRMSLANFKLDTVCHYQNAFFREHPEYYCRSRDGRVIETCSYAYREVQDKVIGTFIDIVKYGFDGISLICHRGIHLAYEKPVTDEFKRRYPNVDPLRVPIEDDRIRGVWCDIMTDFVRRLRAALDSVSDRHIGINVITDYSPETAKTVGIDVETWAREGLIDHVCQDNMEVYEDLDGCLADDGLIDIAKYREELTHRTVVKRFHGNDIERTVNGAREFVRVLDGTGVTFWGGMPWRENDPTINLRWRDALSEVGVDHFSVYNYIHAVSDLPNYQVLAKLCHDSIPTEDYTPNHYRVLSLDGRDISTFNPNWRG